MNTRQVMSHLARIASQLGRPLTLGPRRYRVRGYYASRLALSANSEPWMRTVLTRALAGRPGAFVDVGVNTGQTLAQVLSIDPGRRYVGFDPQIGCCFFVDSFLRENPSLDATVVPLALSDENRVCSLYSDKECDVQATIVGAESLDGHVRRRSTLVPARVGDEVFDEIGLAEIAVVKIDVEGAELKVLSGLTRTLATKRPTLVFEVLPNFYGTGRQMQAADACERNRTVAGRLLDLLARAGYAVKQIDERDGSERDVARFNLDDAAGYVGSNYTARPR